MEEIVHKIEEDFFYQSGCFQRINLADSFVSKAQKIEKGNGEAKLYIGNESKELRNFFGKRPFRTLCFFKKFELLEFMHVLKSEYKSPKLRYRKEAELPQLFDERINMIECQNEIIWFTLCEQDQIAPPRIYVKSSDSEYRFLRELPLPTLSFLEINKLISKNKTIFHLRLVADLSRLSGISAFISDYKNMDSLLTKK